MLRARSHLLVFMAMLALSFLVPDALWAGDNAKYGIDQQTGQDIVDSARSIWGVISIVAIFAGLIGLMVMIFISKLWGFVVVVLAAVAGFGEKIVAYIVKMGGGAGETYFNKKSSSLLQDDSIITLAQTSDVTSAVTSAVHAVLTLFS